MKKFLALILSLICIAGSFCLFACSENKADNNAEGGTHTAEGEEKPNENKPSEGESGGTEKPSEEEGGKTEKPDDTPVPAGNDVLVVYFSCTNTTERIADYVIEKTGGARYEIVPKVPYTEDDLKYYTGCRADKEQADPTARPEIDGKVEEIGKYNTVFIGYPVWHGEAPKIIYTFLESYDFSGKTLIPFCTSHSSGIGSSDTNLHTLAPNAKWKDGKRFAGNASKESVNDWVDGLNIKTETEKDMKVYFTVGTARLAATLEDNAATAALVEKLKVAPITINMSDYGGWEKVGGFGFELPATDEYITAQPCEFVLYQGNQLVIFYGSNSWDYTPLGKFESVTQSELKEILGNGNVTVTLTLEK